MCSPPMKLCPEEAGMMLGVDHGGTGVRRKAFEHHGLQRRRPYLRCTVCLVTPSRSAISCQDQPRSRAF